MSYKNKVLNAIKKTYPVEVPDWGLTVYMKKMSVKEFKEICDVNDFEAAEMQVLLEGSAEDKEKAQEMLKHTADSIRNKIFSCCLDEHGERMFADDEFAEIDEGTTPESLKILSDHFHKINGMNTSIDDAKKN